MRALLFMADRNYIVFAYKIFAEFGITIAVPAVLATILGKKLDIVYDTGNRYLILCLLVAFVVTAIWLVKRAYSLKTELENIDKHS